MTSLRALRAASVAAAILVTCALPSGGASAQRATGLIFASPVERAKIPLAAIPFGGPDLPAEVDHSFNFPAPGQQGGQNSCVGWATAYLKAYQERVEARYSGESVPPMFSPSFVYNQINQGRDGGANIPDALRTLSNVGAVSILEMPYQEADYLVQPTASARAGAPRYRIDSYRQVNVDDVKEVQAHLAAGFPVIIGADVDAGFKRLRSGQVWRSRAGPAEGGHAMVVVGYSRQRNAFKVINSWGTVWGDQGFGWIDFDFFRTVVREGYVARDAVNGGPTRPGPAPGPAPIPRPRPTPVPAPAPIPRPTPVPVPARPVAYTSANAADALIGIFGENIPSAALQAVRAQVRAGYAITSVSATTQGAWVVSYGENGFVTSQTPADLDSTLKVANSRREKIRRVALSPTGAWIVLHGAQGWWTANGLTQADYAGLGQLTRGNEELKDAAFLANGTLVVVRGRNGWWSSQGLPPELLQAMQTLNRNQEEITGISGGGQPQSWLLIRSGNGSWPAWIPQSLQDLLVAINTNQNTIQYATLLPNGGWVLIRKPTR